MKLIPRAKPIRIRIKSGGEEHSSLDSLRKNLSISDIYPLIKDGRLSRWLDQIGEPSMAHAIDDFQFSDETELKYDDYERLTGLFYSNKDCNLFNLSCSLLSTEYRKSGIIMLSYFFGHCEEDTFWEFYEKLGETRKLVGCLQQMCTYSKFLSNMSSEAKWYRTARKIYEDVDVVDVKNLALDNLRKLAKQNFKPAINYLTQKNLYFKPTEEDIEEFKRSFSHYNLVRTSSRIKVDNYITIADSMSIDKKIIYTAINILVSLNLLERKKKISSSYQKCQPELDEVNSILKIISEYYDNTNVMELHNHQIVFMIESLNLTSPLAKKFSSGELNKYTMGGITYVIANYVYEVIMHEEPKKNCESYIASLPCLLERLGFNIKNTEVVHEIKILSKDTTEYWKTPKSSKYGAAVDIYPLLKVLSQLYSSSFMYTTRLSETRASFKNIKKFKTFGIYLEAISKFLSPNNKKEEILSLLESIRTEYVPAEFMYQTICNGQADFTLTEDITKFNWTKHVKFIISNLTKY